MSEMGSCGLLLQLRLLPGKPALAHTLTDERAPGHQVAGKFPGAHPDGGKRCYEAAIETPLPQCLSPNQRPLRMAPYRCPRKLCRLGPDSSQLPST